MRAPRILVAATVLLAAAGCSGPGEQPGAAGSPSSPAPPTTLGPTLAGSAEAAALTGLPAGPAAGTAVLAYSGVGELRAPFTGTCSRNGDTTRLDGSADTARMSLEVAPDGAHVVLDDVGLSATSALATGRYDVSGRHLSLAAPLAADGQEIGWLALEVDCG